MASVQTDGSEDRPRERLFARGADRLSTEELLATLLGSGLRGRPAIDIARELLSNVGGIAALARAAPAELMAARGMGMARASRVIAAFSLADRALEARPQGSRAISSAEDVYKRLRGRMVGLAQEIFIEAYRSLARFDRERSFRAWVRGIARNVIRRHQSEEGREAKLRLDAVSELVRRRADEAGRAEATAADAARDALSHCLDRLPADARRLIHLRYTDEKTSGEIAPLLARTAEAVRMLLVRTRRQLHECVKAELGRT